MAYAVHPMRALIVGQMLSIQKSYKLAGTDSNSIMGIAFFSRMLFNYCLVTGSISTELVRGRIRSTVIGDSTTF